MLLGRTQRLFGARQRLEFLSRRLGEILQAIPELSARFSWGAWRRLSLHPLRSRLRTGTSLRWRWCRPPRHRLAGHTARCLLGLRRWSGRWSVLLRLRLRRPRLGLWTALRLWLRSWAGLWWASCCRTRTCLWGRRRATDRSWLRPRLLLFLGSLLLGANLQEQLPLTFFLCRIGIGRRREGETQGKNQANQPNWESF